MANSKVSEKPLLEKIQDLLELEPGNSDVAFCVGKEKKIVRAVKIILKASSPVLKNKLEKWEVAGIKKSDEIPLPDFDPIAFKLFVKITSLDAWSLESLKALNLPLYEILNLLSICQRFEIKAAEENLKILATGISRLGSTQGFESAKNPPIVCDDSQNTQLNPQSLESASSIQLPAEASLSKMICWGTKINGGKKINGFPRKKTHAEVAVGNAIYSFGSANEDGHPSYSRGVLDVFVLNTIERKKKWKKLPIENSEANPDQRYYHSAVAYKEFVLIFGGYKTEKYDLLNSTYRFNTETLNWDKPKVTGNVPGARWFHSAVVLRNEMVIYGGIGDGLANELHSLDLESFRWSTIKTKGIPPPFRQGHSATVYDDRFILIFGGQNFKESTKVSTIASFDLNNKTWSAVEMRGTPPSSRSGHCAFVHNRRMYIFGGFFNDQKAKYFNDVFSYDPETCEWEEVTPNGEAPSPRAGAGCVALNGQVFIFGGYHYSNSRGLGDTHVLQMQI